MLWRHLSTISTLIVLATSAGCERWGAVKDDTPSLAAWPSTAVIIIDDPYADVDWAEFGRHRANLHTHTNESDGLAPPDIVIDRYHELDYEILALTDHDTNEPESTTWPWSSHGRDPAQLGMIAIEGNELSRHHHMGSFYTGYGAAEVESLDAALTEIGALGGAAILFHPGRYGQSTDWYVDLFERHPHLVGTEVVNQVDRYPGDRERWDEMLAALMPRRNVWAFSNDDMHVLDLHLGYSWNVVLVRELDDASVRRAIERGHLYWVHAPEGSGGPPAPAIVGIAVDQDSATITIDAEHTERIDWISGGSVVHEGASVDIYQLSAQTVYVRAELHGAGGSFAGTQAFGVRSR